MSDTPRTDRLSAVVQNQNWGFRDMQRLAQQLEGELNAAKAENERLRAALINIAEYWNGGDDAAARDMAEHATHEARRALEKGTKPPADYIPESEESST